MFLDCQAIVLSGQKLGEADTLVTLLTAERGVIKGVARAARRVRNRFGGSIQPFTYGQAVLFRRGREGLRSLTHFDPIHSFHRLRESYDLLCEAAAMANAARRLVPEEQGAAQSFAALLRSLRTLEAGRNVDTSVCWYLLALLRHSGYQPLVDRCVANGTGRCETGNSGGWVFVPSLGGTVCAGCRQRRGLGAGQGNAIRLTASALAMLRQAVRMPQELVGRLTGPAEVIREIRGALEACVEDRGRHFGKRPVPGAMASSAVNAEPARYV